MNKQPDEQQPLPWWKRWTSRKVNWWLTLALGALILYGVVFVLIPYVTHLVGQLSGSAIS